MDLRAAKYAAFYLQFIQQMSVGKEVIFWSFLLLLFTFHSHVTTHAVMTADRISSLCVDIVLVARSSLCLQSPELSISESFVGRQHVIQIKLCSCLKREEVTGERKNCINIVICTLRHVHY
jgi:hypothetical protein